MQEQNEGVDGAAKTEGPEDFADHIAVDAGGESHRKAPLREATAEILEQKGGQALRQVSRRPEALERTDIECLIRHIMSTYKCKLT